MNISRNYYVFKSDAEKYYPKITDKELEKYFAEHPEEMELIADSCKSYCSLEIIKNNDNVSELEDDKNEKATRDKAFRGIFNKGNKRWG